jgi:hypothetical protein
MNGKTEPVYQGVIELHVKTDTHRVNNTVSTQPLSQARPPAIPISAEHRGAEFSDLSGPVGSTQPNSNGVFDTLT